MNDQDIINMHQLVSFDIVDYKIDLLMTEEKIRVTATSQVTHDLYLCEIVHGNISEQMTAIFQDQQWLFDHLFQMAKNKELRISEGKKLMIPYKIELLGRSIKKEFSLLMTKMQLNDFDNLKRQVKVLQTEERSNKLVITRLQEEAKIFRQQLKYIKLLNNYFTFAPGCLKSLLTFQQQSIEPEYRLRTNYLFRRTNAQLKQIEQSDRDIRSVVSMIMCISSEPINEYEQKVFSFQMILQSGCQMFVGLCHQRKPKSSGDPFQEVQTKPAYEFINSLINLKNKQENPLLFKNKNDNLCNFYANIRYRYRGIGWKKSDQKGQSERSFKFVKGDRLTMTVDMNELHMTWFCNGLCIQRTYFEEPTSNVYPFIYLPGETEVVLQ